MPNTLNPDKLRELRQGKDLSQTELATRCGIAAQKLSDYERGKSTPGLKNLCRLADALEVGIEELLAQVDSSGELPADKVEDSN